MSQNMVMDKEFFRRQLVLWGDAKQVSLKAIPGDVAHRFHFSFTMPYVNMPTPRQTPDIEISYSLEASLFMEAFDQQRGDKSKRDVHKTSIKHFRFEPVVQQLVDYASSAPFETVVPMNDAPPLAPGDPRYPTSSLPSLSLLSFQSAKKPHMALNVIQPTSAFLPGETVDLLLLAPSGKKITNALFQVRENVRCRKSSAPIIDESDVPVLWKYSVDLTSPQEITFNKLTKSAVAQDIGLLGRCLVTSQPGAPQGVPQGVPQGIPGDVTATISSPPPPPAPPHNPHSASDSPSASAGDQGSRILRIKPEDGLAIVNVHVSGARSQQRSGVQLSPLAESHEANGSCASDAFDSAGTAHALDASPLLPHSPPPLHGPPLAGIPARGRTGSLGAIPAQHLYSQSYGPGAPPVAVAAAVSAATPHHNLRARSTLPMPASGPYHGPPSNVPGSRMSKSISPEEMDDSISERSSISDSMSIRYQPTKALLAANFPSLNRGAQATAAGARGLVRTSEAPAALGGLLPKGSYKFARIRFTLPPVTEMSPVSSVYLDFEYTVDISMSIGGSFGTTKRALGKLPLKIVTVRSAPKLRKGASTNSGYIGSQAMTDPAASTHSLRDSLSCLNLSITHSDEALGGGPNSNGSPANTLTEVHFDAPGVAAAAAAATIAAAHGDPRLVDGSYPCLLSFIQNGEKVPAPALEYINIGSRLM
ncbi:hypothetical protein LPJ61_005006 [Coemansia biformis]|uniref:Arrestin-like N-terminal domain-containing protein n=1 Tax=Coemansia biformis TaxID=1286918 RepID=A0A9W7Y957_9FUNG|nr:hypothetical protein LPJ61_005006 [Coemansia biformis]